MRVGDVARLLIGTWFDYLRWTQLVPMIVVWGFVLIGVLGATLVSFQDQSVAALIWLHQATAPIPGLHAAIGGWLQESGATTPAGGLHLTDEQLTPLLVRGWGLLSLALFLLSALWHGVRGTKPGPRKPLSSKLIVAGLASALTVGVTAVILLLGQQGNEIELGDALMTGAIGFVILLAVSTYSLTAAHLLSWLSEQLVTGSKTSASSSGQP